MVTGSLIDTSAPDVALRLLVLSTLDTAGLTLDPEKHRRYLTGCHVVAAPFAGEIRDRLEALAFPETEVEYSFLTAMDTMAAFACATADHVYESAAAGKTYRDQVRRSLTVYVVGSAVFDYVCDHEPALLQQLESRVSADWVRAALGGEAPSDPLATYHDSHLLTYLGALLAEAAQLWRRLAWLRRDRTAVHLRDVFVSDLRAAYRAQLRSVVRFTPAQDRTAERAEIIWATPFWIASSLLSLTPDAGPERRFQALAEQAKDWGRLLSLVDDVVDLEDDWVSANQNQYLKHAGILPDRPRRSDEIPWDVLLSEEISAWYLREITEAVRRLTIGDRKHLAAWLFYWLSW